MDDKVIGELEAEFARLHIGSSQADVHAVVGDPPWLYSPEFLVAVARTLPDGAGAEALGRALAAALAFGPPRSW
jgi:hypothetical protein